MSLFHCFPSSIIIKILRANLIFLKKILQHSCTIKVCLISGKTLIPLVIYLTKILVVIWLNEIAYFHLCFVQDKIIFNSFDSIIWKFLYVIIDDYDEYKKLIAFLELILKSKFLIPFFSNVLLQQYYTIR